MTVPDFSNAAIELAIAGSVARVAALRLPGGDVVTSSTGFGDGEYDFVATLEQTELGFKVKKLEVKFF